MQEQTTKFKPYTRQSIKQSPQWATLGDDQRQAVEVVSRVLPFRLNQYVLDELIDWSNIPDDPLFRLTFPHRKMLRDDEYIKLRDLMASAAPELEIESVVHSIRMRMNPHPAGQATHNVAYLEGVPLNGLQHKYRETVLFFPSAGQSCHAYCTFCFRWPQFVGMDELKFDARSSHQLVEYRLLRHRRHCAQRR